MPRTGSRCHGGFPAGGPGAHGRPSRRPLYWKPDLLPRSWPRACSVIRSYATSHSR